MRHAEQNLDKFWSTTDSLLLKTFGGLNKTAFASLAKRELQRTGPWVEPPAKSKAAVDVAVLHKPMSDLALDSGRSKPTPSPPVPKTKVKTRGVARPPDTAAATPSEQDGEGAKKGEPAPQIGVDARALKTFRNLFFNPNVSATPGEIPWKDFRHAMATAGFEPHKLYGSAWQFQSPVSTMIFHEPHPNPKIPIWEARRMGRRLSRAYGWDISTFVLRDKATDGSA